MNRRDRGRREFEGLIGAPPEDALAEVRLRSPQLYDTVLDSAASTLAHAELGRADREIATVAILAAIGGAEAQLARHTKSALGQGVSPAELRALCEHVALYAGFPRGLNALAMVDRALTDAGLPRPPRTSQVTLADHETLVAQRGEAGPAVLLVHSLGVDWCMWEPVLDRIAEGRRVFAYDLRGHGHAAGAPTPFTMADTARDLVGVLDALGLDRAHVVGLSLGGAIAQAAAVAYPERVESLALLATVDVTFPEAFEARAVAAEAHGMRAMVASTLTRWFTADALAENGWGVRYARERLLRFDPADWAAMWRAYRTLDVRGRLGEFSAPTLVLAGGADAAIRPEVLSDLAGRIPGARFQELPATPHMQTLERPELVADALNGFLPAAGRP
ncbi:alpha/beta fold hydrolase [Solihabitans fulvus]|uniref:Alpha/beta fold hydrolase n=1 Tax=Solihabitans fulvus TaxID=1892852 RepID=A0A5B2WVE0_9PSEU|nr:alpha/beta fold hydrolase [Solihabitans fulvus]KAA2253867.1 alpha/beta fold hydrolase [Solihabitans fulvus]